MHSKRKGNLGQSAVIKELMKLGYSVFSELGDISKIDIIAEKNGHLIRIQCKGYAPKNGSISVPFKKSGPNYQFRYTADMFDFFAVYDLIHDKVYLISADLIKTKKHICLRVLPSKNNQSSNVNFAEEFAIEKILRDYTPNTRNCDDIVQTTTLNEARET